MNCHTCMTVLVLATTIVWSTSGCDWIGRHAYQPDFRYLEPAELRDGMAQLTEDVGLLDQFFAHGEPPIDRRDRLVTILREMEAIVAKLDPEGRETNYPLIDQHMPEFRRSLATAREDAERTPPNYFLASSIEDACRLCHKSPT